MKRKRIISIIACMLLCVMCLAGCGSSSSESASTDEGTKTLDMSTGIVKSIDANNSQITISVMDMSKFGGEPPTGENGERPSKPDGQPPEGFDGEPPEGFDGEPPEGFDGIVPTGENGEPPSRPDGEVFAGAMEEKTYALSSSVYIQDENGSTIALEEVTEGAFIEFTVDGDEITTISLKKYKNDDK